jgi:hypothetical protein
MAQLHQNGFAAHLSWNVMLSISIGLEEGARRRPAERVDEVALPVARLRNELADEDHGQESDRQAEKGRGLISICTGGGMGVTAILERGL